MGRIDRPAPADLAANRHARRATAVPTMRGLDDRGRFLIPRAIRTQLGVAPGDELLPTVVTSHNYIAVADPTVGFDAAPLSLLDLPRSGPRTVAECFEHPREFG